MVDDLDLTHGRCGASRHALRREISLHDHVPASGDPVIRVVGADAVYEDDADVAARAALPLTGDTGEFGSRGIKDGFGIRAEAA